MHCNNVTLVVVRAQDGSHGCIQSTQGGLRPMCTPMNRLLSSDCWTGFFFVLWRMDYTLCSTAALPTWSVVAT